MKVFILTEGGEGVGFGHIARCISLYQAFKEQNITPELIVNSDNSVLDLLKGKNYCVLNWLREKNKLFRKIINADIIVVDSYLAEISFYEKVSELTKLAVYIDDTKRLNYPRGIALNGMIYAENIKYPKKKNINYMLGIKYSPLRKEFWRVPKKLINKSVKSVMVILGGNDGRNMMPKIIKFLNEEYPGLTKNAVIGKGFKNIEEIRKIKNGKVNLIYNPDAKGMRKLMVKSDIAISAGGQTLCELARVGVPTVGICLAANQKWNLEEWKKIGFIEYAGWWKNKNLFAKLKNCIRIISPYAQRTSRAMIGINLVDGKGAGRVVEILVNQVRHKKAIKRQLKLCFVGGKQAGIIGALTALSKGNQILSAVSYSDDLTSILKALDIPLYKSVKDKDFIKRLRIADLLLSVHGREIVKSDLLKLPKFGGINLHPYLYKYKGANPIARAFKDKELKASVGAHVMRDEIDQGEVLVEEFVNVSEANSMDGIYNKLYPYYSIVVLKVLNMLCNKYEKRKK